MNTAVQFKTFAFQEFEEYTSTIVHADVRCTTPSIHHMFWELSHLAVGSLHLQLGSESSGNIAEGAVDRDGGVIFLQTSGDWGQANGQRLAAGRVVVIGPGQEFCMSFEGMHDWLSIRVPSSFFEAENSGRESWLSASARQTGLESDVQRLLSDVERFTSLVRSGANDSHVSSIANAFEMAFATSLGVLLNHPADFGTHGLGRPRLISYRVIRRAIDILESTERRCTNIADLSKALNVSARALRDGFQHYLGTSPIRLMQARRLQRARARLRAADPGETTVTDVAAAVGMWDVGRFARRYRMLFGENPSETLRQPARRP